MYQVYAINNKLCKGARELQMPKPLVTVPERQQAKVFLVGVAQSCGICRSILHHYSNLCKEVCFHTTLCFLFLVLGKFFRSVACDVTASVKGRLGSWQW